MVQGPTFFSLRAEISGIIVPYDALAPCPELLLLWHFVGACAATLKLKIFPYSWRKYPHRVDYIQHTVDVIYWGEFLQQVDNNFTFAVEILLEVSKKQVGNTFTVGKTVH